MSPQKLNQPHHSTREAPSGPLQQAGVTEGRFSGRTLELKELTRATLLRLHSLEDIEQLATRVLGAGISLPLRTGQSTGREPAALCLRPNEWLLFSETQAATALEQPLLAAVNTTHTSVLDHSDGLAVFRLSGKGAPWLLSKLSGLDYSTATREGQHCTRTRVARIAVVIHYHPAEDERFSFDLIFDRSVTKYLWDLLIASADHADELAITCGEAQCGPEL